MVVILQNKYVYGLVGGAISAHPANLLVKKDRINIFEMKSTLLKFETFLDHPDKPGGAGSWWSRRWEAVNSTFN